MPRISPVLWTAGSLVMCFFASLPASGQVSACKYLLVRDFTSDPYSIAQELRAQARKRGFTVILAFSEVPEEEFFKTCVMKGSWAAQIGRGEISVQVLDAASADVIGEAGTAGTNWWGVGRTVRKAVAKIYSQLGYSGFNEEAYRSKMQRLYPRRPMLAVSEEQIKANQPKGHLEGIWSDPEDKYRLGIVPAPQGSGADFFGVILRSNSPVWQAGEIKAEFHSTASPDVFTCTYFLANKKSTGTSFVLEHDMVLHAQVSALSGPTDVTFLRVWPKAQEQTRADPAKGGVSGTGFLLNKNGLIATNWHVVAEATHVAFALPGWKEEVPVDILIKDAANDLAILRVIDSVKLTSACPEVPYQLTSSNSVTLGEHISTIGYPLTTFLGSNPKFTEGVVSSKSGLQDDPRHFQISAQIEPGSSGSPLFDPDGNVIGIVVATLDAAKLVQSAGVLPQNVNYAIKSDYLLSLMAMLPIQSPGTRNGAFSPEKAAQCVAFIHAW